MDDFITGWEKVESNSKPGKFYWFHTETGETSWKRPVVEEQKDAKQLPRPLPPTPTSHLNQSAHQQQPRVIKFTAKIVLSVNQLRNVPKGKYYCELTLYTSNTQRIEAEDCETDYAEGSAPAWKESFHFGAKLDLEAVAFIQVDVWKKTMFSRKSIGKVTISLHELRQQQQAAAQSGQQKHELWHPLEKTKKMKTVAGELYLILDYRPGGEFVEGGVSNVQHHGHVGITDQGKLDLKNIPAPWKNLFKEAGIRKKDIKNNSDAVMKVLVQYGFIPRSMLPDHLLLELDESNDGGGGGGSRR